MKNRVRVAIVGVSADRGWGSVAHIPALRALSDDIEIVGVANTNRVSAEAAAKAFSLGRAYDSVDSLLASPDVDVVAVTVKVPYHLDLVTKTLEAGKNVYCEWPLGNGLAEAEKLAALARRKQALAVVGTQAVVSPEVQFVRDLVADGFVGEVRSTTYIGSGYTWGDEVTAGDAYAMDSKNGATLLSIVAGHAFSAMQSVLGPVSRVSGLVSQRRSTVRIVETGEAIPMKTPDQVIVAAEFNSGVPLAFHLRGASPVGRGSCGRSAVPSGIYEFRRRSNRFIQISTSPPCSWRRGSAGSRDSPRLRFRHPTTSALMTRPWREMLLASTA